MEINKILYILSGNLSTTPRALKSIIVAKKYFDVYIIAVNRNNSWHKLDKQIIKEYNLNYTTVSLGRKPFLEWFFSSMISKISKILYPFFKNQIGINAFASSKVNLLIAWKVFKLKKNKYKLLVGHSSSSLFPAYKLSKKLNIPFIFDIEDFHPGEFCSAEEKQRREFLMQKLLPKADYITYASPLIGEYSLKLLENYPENRHQLINNCFSANEFQFKENNTEKIKFVWFSQNIAAGRGLELVVPALKKFQNKIKLHLIGNLYQNFYDDFLSKYSDFITIHKPLLQKDLNLKLAEFDIGLAIELNTSDFNRQICLTNKIWAYFQSGLYILASNTPAQLQFIRQFNNFGLISGQNQKSFELAIDKILHNIQTIRKEKEIRFSYAQNFAWEQESEKLHQIWDVFIK